MIIYGNADHPNNMFAVEQLRQFAVQILAGKCVTEQYMISNT